MHNNFIALEQKKRDRIINAAFREFSAKGFKNASTNKIVNKAGISKGALFHYFSSKQDLFKFLYKYSMDFLLETIEPYMESMPTDVFERWSAFSVLKLKVGAQYPEMSDFVQIALRDDASEVQEFLKTMFNDFSKDFPLKIYEGIDVFKFRQDLDVPKVLQIIWWTLEGFAMKMQKEPFDHVKIKDSGFLQTITKEIESYLTILKQSFYKEEYL